MLTAHRRSSGPFPAVRRWDRKDRGFQVIRIAALGQWSVRYYESTAVRANEYGGGLSEYYTERDTRAPMVYVVGDREFAQEHMGVEHGGGISQQEVTQWFENAVSPGGPGVGKARMGTLGWDVLFTVPKSVSMLAALSTDPEVASIIMRELGQALEEAMTSLHNHAGYTRVTNALDPSKKDLQRLPALPFVVYTHHTARPNTDGRCDPHIHFHALLPGKIAREDGRMVTIDSESMYHEAKSAGMIFQKIMRDRLSAALGIEWDVVDPHTGLAEMKGMSRETIKEWSRRRTAILDWALENPSQYAKEMFTKELADGEAAVEAETATESEPLKEDPRWLDVGQKATRNKKLETLHYDQLREEWLNDPRAQSLNLDAYLNRVLVAAAKDGPGTKPTAKDVFELLGTVKNTWTRADVVEAVTALWGPGRGLEVVTLADIEAAVDEIVEAGCFQTVEDRKSWHREGHLRYTDAITLSREADVMELSKVTAKHYEIAATPAWFRQQGLSPTQAKVMAELAVSKRLINVLEAPAGAGKTSSLRALRKRAEAQGKHVVVMSNQRKAINEARKGNAAHEYRTVASVRVAIAEDRLDWGRDHILIVDEAAMSGDRDLYEIFKAAAAAHAKVIMVGDSHQLQPVRAGGGMFADLAEQLPWAQAFDEVWRQKDRIEASMTLLMREAKTEAQFQKVAAWYSANDRLRAGDTRSMFEDLIVDYFDWVVAGRDVIVIADKWELADAVNMRIQSIRGLAELSPEERQRVIETGIDERPSVPILREQRARIGDVIMTDKQNWDIDVYPEGSREPVRDSQTIIATSDRWEVIGLHEDGSIEALRQRDNASATLPAKYATEHVTLGYAGTVNAAQGVNANVGLCIGNPQTMHKQIAYPGLTRGDEMNMIYMAVPIAGEDDHHTSTGPELDRETYTDEQARGLFAGILKRDDREQTALKQAEEAMKEMNLGADHALYAESFGGIDPYVAQLVHNRAELREQFAIEYAAELAAREGWQEYTEQVRERAIEHDRSREEAKDDISRDRDIEDNTPEM